MAKKLQLDDGKWRSETLRRFEKAMAHQTQRLSFWWLAREQPGCQPHQITSVLNEAATKQRTPNFGCKAQNNHAESHSPQISV